MEIHERYKNTGVYAVGEDPSRWVHKPRTILVLGVARSGTSVISGTLHHLGVFTGDLSKEPVYEDVRLSNAIKTTNWTNVEKVIRDYDKRYPLWAYKRPNIVQATQQLGRSGQMLRQFPLLSSSRLALSSFNKFIARLRNPIFVVTFKDLFAISNRNRISMNFDLLDNLSTVWRQYGRLLQLIRRPGFNGLLVSVDRVIYHKETFLSDLISFCGLTPTPDQLSKARVFITSNPEHYLDEARTSKSIGYLDEVSANCIHGWARYLDNERVATVVLSIDGREVARTEANVFRQDLFDNEQHSTGKCAFRFQNFDGSLLRSGSEVRVRVTEDVKDLGNCPHTYVS